MEKLQHVYIVIFNKQLACACILLSLFVVGPPYTLHFRVKFYAAEPQDLHEELTR